MAIIAALFAAAAVVLGTTPWARAGAAPTDPDPPAAPGPVAAREEPGRLARAAWMSGALAGLAAWLLLGGALGAAAGAVTAVLIATVLSRFETSAQRRRRLALVRSAPLVADLLGAALSAGIPLERAVPVVARAVGGPAAEVLRGVERRLGFGEPAASAWATAADIPGLGVLARTVARSSRTGAPLAELLAAAAGDLRSAAAAAALAEIRATSVRAVLPLGVCLLPSFVLLGIAPVVGGLVPSM